MTITRGGLAGGTPADNTTSVVRSVGSVTAGQMVVFGVVVLNLSGADDLFAAGDLTKTAGTATIDTPQLDVQAGGQIGGGPEWLRVGIYSCLVTGSGTLTLTHAGAPSGSYLWGGVEAYNGSWDASRFEDSAGSFDATNNASSASTGNMDSAGGALFVGLLGINNGANVTTTPDAAWNALASETSSAHVMASLIDRIVTGATTDSADWTFAALDNNGYAGTAFAGAVYKEAASGSPATLSSPTPSGTLGTSTTATIGATTDTTSGTLYVVADTASLSGITATQVIAGQNASSAAADAAANAAVSTTTPSAGVTGLSPGTAYNYAVAQVSAGGNSNVVTGSFTTASLPTLEQEGFRFGNDDGDEASHTWAAAQDTSIAAPADQTHLLNIIVNATGSPGAKTFKLQFRKSGGDTWQDVPIAE